MVSTDVGRGHGNGGNIMARKKAQTYNDVVRTIVAMQQLLVARKRHMVEVLTDAMDDGTAAMLGDFTDAELRRLARLMFANAAMFVDMAELCEPKPQRSQEADDAPMVEGEVRSDCGKNCWDVWDTETAEKLGTLRDGMHVELLTREGWVPAQVYMCISPRWSFHAPSLPDGVEFMLTGDRVRLRKADLA